MVSSGDDDEYIALGKNDGFEYRIEACDRAVWERVAGLALRPLRAGFGR